MNLATVARPGGLARALFLSSAFFSSVALMGQETVPNPPSLPDLVTAIELPTPNGLGVGISQELELDTYTIKLKGDLFPIALPNTVGAQSWFFSGDGQHVLKPITNSEWRSLRFRSQQSNFTELETRFTTALLWTDGETGAKLLENATETDRAAPQPAAIAEVLSSLRGSEHADLPLRIASALTNHTSVAPGVQFAYLLTNASEPGPTLVGHDSRGILDGEETALYVFPKNAEDTAQARRKRDADDEPVSDPGYWYSSPDIEAVRAGQRFGEGSQPLIDVERVTVTSSISRDVDLNGRSTVSASVLATSVAVLPFDLSPQLRVTTISAKRNDQPIETDFVQAEPEQGRAAAVMFNEPVVFGDQIELEFEYAGDSVLIDDGVRTYRVAERASWYPNFDDLAHFDLTFEVPKGNTVIAVGEPKSNRTADGKVISTWKTKTPIRVAGFNYGSFKEYEAREENTGYDLAVYASIGVPDIITEINGQMRDQSRVMTPSEAAAVASSGITLISQYSGATDLGISIDGLAQSAMADAQNSVQIFTARFGPSPFDRLAITQQAEWTFGQAWPGLIYLPYTAAFSSSARATLGLSGMAQFIDEVGIHEIAHQWWGHLVGWKTYRDQWISEGFAEFAASLVV